MIKIAPYRFSYPKSKPSIKQRKENNHKNMQIKLSYLAPIPLLIGGRIALDLLHNKKISCKSLTEIQKQMQEFPLDITYRKNILKAMGLNTAEYVKLRPIVGPQEFKKTIQDFSSSAIHYTPGTSLITDIQDNFVLTGVKQKTYRATMHNHTLFSDGRISVKALLDESAKYADEVAEQIKNKTDVKAKYAPFTVAITDHDTIDSCKEAVKIILENPEKYKNLRVVLGSEFTVENRLLGDKLKKPINQHITLNAINPFDKTLNEFIDSKKLARKDLMMKIIDKANEKIKEQRPDLANLFNFEEAETLYPVLKYKILHINSSIQNYLLYKTLFTECFQNNKNLQTELLNKGLDISKTTYRSFLNKYLGDTVTLYAENGYKRYYNALKKYTADLLGISEKEAEQKLAISNNLKKTLDDLCQITIKEEPQMNLQPAYVDFEDAIKLVNDIKDGYITWAHPGCTNMADFLKNPDLSIECINELIKLFKEKGGEKSLAAEIYYQYHGELGKSTSWLKNIEHQAKLNNIIPTGGLDTHGTNIFYSNRNL